MQRPVYDRGTRADPVGPTMRTLDATQPSTEDLLAKQYEDIMAEQTAANEAAGLARQTEIDALRDALREELASSEDAALSQRSDLTTALEGRIDELRRGVDAETLDLRQAGLDERAELARQIEEGDKLVREAQTAAIGDLSDRQGSLISDLKTRIGSLSGNLTDINSVIEGNYSQLNEAQKSSADATQSEINSLNQQLETLYTDVDSGNAAQSEAIRSETADLVSALEQQIGGVAENLGSLPIESIQNQLSGLSDQTAQFQSAVDSATSERENLASMIEALQTGALSQEDLTSLSQSIAEQRGTDISSALSPLQEQITSLQGQIPAEVDVEALRKQITEEVMGQVSQQGGGATADVPTGVNPNVSAGVGAGGVPYTGGSVGSYEPEMGAYGVMPTTEGAAEMGATPYFDSAGIGNEMGQGQFDSSGVAALPAQATHVMPDSQYQADQGLLDQFNTSQAAKDFGLNATFDPETGRYVTDVGGFGFTGDQQYKYQTPEEFAAQFKNKKDTQQAAVAPPPAVQGSVRPRQQPPFNPAGFKPQNMSFM
jgi:polyhydroxyalkanoate synthesis regulator phasin